MIKLFERRNYLKVLSTTVLLAAVLMPAGIIQAASFTADKPTLRVSNYTDHPNSNSDWFSSVSADAGDIISFNIYYHNSSNEAANQTRVKLNLPSGQFTSGSISATVSAQDANQMNGSVSVSLSSSQALTLRSGEIFWYKNGNVDYSQSQSLPSGQNGSEIISGSGINLGNIPAGDRGQVVVRVQVGSNSSGSAPVVNTNSAYSIYQNSAYLSGNVDPNNSNTDFWFEYGTNSSLGSTVNFQSIGSGDSSINESYYLSGLQSNTTYYYRAVARNQYGTNYGSILNFYTQSGSNNNSSAPTVFTNSATSITYNSAVLNGSIDANGSYTNAWFEYGTSQSFGYTTGSQSVGSSNYSNDYSSYISNLSPNTTYHYRAVASNSYGTNYGGTLTFYTNSSGQIYYSNQPTVTTVNASPVYQNSALVNGSVNPNGGYTTAWFQWGTNNNLGNTTVSQSVGSGTNFTNSVAALTGLSANTTYYYRAVASNNSGTVYGNILSFNTQATTPVVYQYTQPQVIYVSNAVKTALPSLVLLISNADRETAIAGGELHYVVVYKNLSQQKLTDVVLKVIFPLEVNYVSSNPKAISLEGNTITYRVGTLDPDEEGSMDVEFAVKNSVRNNDSLIFSATLDYQDKNNALHSDNTFLSVSASNRPSLLASLFSIGGFGGILFWGLILGIIIGFLIYWFGLRRRFVKSY
ncbi:MAG: hypothetical protein WC297_00750 [Candidatus Paceibacterota bacterium]|jgi:hypothetical protein